MSKIKFQLMGASAVAIASVAFAAPAFAQAENNDSANDRDTIVVTAQKKAENVQDVPIAITALNAAALEAARVEDSKDLQFNAPNVTLSANRNITIRGVGSASYGGTGDTNIGVLVNGVFLQSGSSFGEFFDMERIEVLRGPQGTLFGRNSTAGLINIVTKGPKFDRFSAKGSVSYGNYDYIRVDGAINAPLGETVAARLDAVWQQRDGFIENDFDISEWAAPELYD